MVFGKVRGGLREIRIACEPLERVKHFDYLGIRLNESLRWEQQLDKSYLVLCHRSKSILRFHKQLYTQSLTPALEVYCAKAQSGALYGAEIWGHTSVNKLMICENIFARSLISVCITIPLIPLLCDLGMKRIGDMAALKPLTYWLRLWTTPQLTDCLNSMREVLMISGAKKLPWFKHIADWCKLMKMSDLWERPDKASRDDLLRLKARYWAVLEEHYAIKSANGQLTSKFLTVNHVCNLNPFWIKSRPPLLKVYMSDSDMVTGS